jgi:signal transduction histidine kinase
LVLAREDDSARLATADVLRALAVAAVVLVLVGIPLAAGLSRSVTDPLRRLAAASGAVAGGAVPEPLPTVGPMEVAEASAAFNAMAAEVDATRRTQRQLLADVRHDLRTPLTVIAGFSEALRDGTASGAAAERAAAAISDEAGRLERMLADLDHLAAPGVDGPALRLERLDGVVVAQATVERFAAEAEARGQALSLAASHDGAASTDLTADRDALDRILGNVVANALAHAPAPGGRIVLEVAARSATDPPVGGPGGWAGRAGVLLAVRDDGPQQPGFRSRPSHRQGPRRIAGGTGLCGDPARGWCPRRGRASGRARPRSIALRPLSGQVVEHGTAPRAEAEAILAEGRSRRAHDLRGWPPLRPAAR